jgi:hypothetical protein
MSGPKFSSIARQREIRDILLAQRNGVIELRQVRQKVCSPLPNQSHTMTSAGCESIEGSNILSQ